MKAYAGAIISVDDVLARFKGGAPKHVIATALSKYGLDYGRSKDLERLWTDRDGSATLAYSLGDGFWERFEELAPTLVTPDQIILFDGAKEFAQSLCFPNVGLIFNSPKGTYQPILEALGIAEREFCFLGSFHHSEGRDFGVKRSLSSMIETSLENMWFYRTLKDAVYIDRGTDDGFTCAKGRHVDYWAVDVKSKRGTDTKYVFQHIVHSLGDLKKHVDFIDMNSIFEIVREAGYELEPRRESRRDKKASRKNKKDRKKH